MTMAPLLEELRDRARAEADERLAAARDEAARLLAATRQRLARASRMAVEHHRRELARIRDDRLDAARQEAGRAMLAARQRFITRVLAAVRARASALTGDGDADAWLARTLADALDYLPPGPVVVRTSDPRGADIVRRIVGERPVRVERLTGTAGVVMESEDGRVRVDATLEHFLRAEGPRLALALVARVEKEP